MQIITRANYGTFKASPLASDWAMLRSVQLPIYFLFLIDNFTFLAILFFIIGVFYLRFKNLAFFRIFGLAFLFSGPFFVFFGSFSLNDNFTIGIYERFLIMSFPFFISFVLMCMEAFVFFSSKIIKYKSFYGIYLKPALVSRFLYLSFLLLPVWLFYSNYKNFLYLKTDFFADNLGKDILESVEPNSILILSYDLPLFNSQYQHFVLKQRPDIKLIHFSLLSFDYYPQRLKKYYPELYFPDKDFNKDYLKDFLRVNSQKFPIYSNIDMIDDGWREPCGLLQKYHQEKETIPAKEKVIENNKKLWDSYQDLTFLKKNKNYFLMPLAVLDVYKFARIKLGEIYLNSNIPEQALIEFEASRQIGETTLALVDSALAHIKLKNCQQAEQMLQEALADKNYDKIEIYKFLWLNAKECFKDSQKQNYYEEKVKEASSSAY